MIIVIIVHWFRTSMYIMYILYIIIDVCVLWLYSIVWLLYACMCPVVFYYMKKKY